MSEPHYQTYAEHLSLAAKEARRTGNFDEMNRCLNSLAAGSPAEYAETIFEMMKEDADKLSETATKKE